MVRLIVARKLKMSQQWSGEKVRSFTEIAVEGEINLADFVPGVRVKVRGISKGKGFAGVIKRHHFHGGPATHGQSDRQRAPGAIGSGTTPGRVLKGKKMAGRAGHAGVSLVTEVISSNAESGRLRLVGGLPGHFGSRLILRKI